LHQLIRTIANFEEQALSKSANGLRTIVKSNKDERIDLLNLLGIIGVLETPEHRGCFKQFVPADEREEKNRNGTHDWLYPVSRWSARDGLNNEALEFWFGDYGATA
jgi:hypothetical protein